MKVLIVKLSSMGDVIHTLPAISDASKRLPDISFDWVVDRAFAQIPGWHQQVTKVIASAHRHWKHHLFASLQDGAIRKFLQQLRKTHYDVVIDAQASLKSASIARLAKTAKRAGMNSHSVREYGAHWMYQQRYSIDKQQHAITRIRQLFARALDYSTPTTKADFGIAIDRLKKPEAEYRSPYVLFIPNASWQSKLYPQKHWQHLIAQATQQFSVLVPWGNEAEKQYAQTITAKQNNAHVLPRLSLSELGYLIKNAKGVISVDTGLGHLATALDVPTVSLYGPTDPQLIGAAKTQKQHDLQTKLPCIPCYKRQCHYQDSLHQEAVCLEKLTPETVWERFYTSLS